MQRMIKGMTEVCVYISAEIAGLLSLTVSTVDGTTTSINLLLMDKIGTKFQYDLYAASLTLQTTLCWRGIISFKLQICDEVS